jgi:hypothetical protein
MIILGCLDGKRSGDMVVYVGYDHSRLINCINQEFEQHIKQCIQIQSHRILSNILIDRIIQILLNYLY